MKHRIGNNLPSFSAARGHASVCRGFFIVFLAFVQRHTRVALCCVALSFLPTASPALLYVCDYDFSGDGCDGNRTYREYQPDNQRQHIYDLNIPMTFPPHAAMTPETAIDYSALHFSIVHNGNDGIWEAVLHNYIYFDLTRSAHDEWRTDTFTIDRSCLLPMGRYETFHLELFNTPASNPSPLRVDTVRVWGEYYFPHDTTPVAEPSSVFLVVSSLPLLLCLRKRHPRA